MNCFNHRSATAVGICKSCGKALCPHCAVEVPHGLACRNSCEERVNLINRIIDLNARAVTIANTQVRSAGILVFTLGLCLLAFAALTYSEKNTFLTMFLGAPGLLFTIYGLMRLLSKGFPNPNAEPRGSQIME